MARVFLMTWVPGRRRWTKKYKGKMYVVSPQHLGVPASKDGSYQAANAWWQKKQDEIDQSLATPKPLPPDPSSAAVKPILDRTSLADRRQMVDQGQAAAKVIGMLEEASVHGAPPPGPTFPCAAPMRIAESALASLGKGESLPTTCIDTVLTDGRDTALDDEDRYEELRRVSGDIRPSKPDIDPDRTVGGQVKAWGRLQQAAQAAGNISAGRYDAYRRNVGVFEQWIGAGQEITAITAFKLEEFYTHLCLAISGGRYSPSYARSIFGATKQFVKRLAELGLIPLPGNFASRKFKFDDGAKEIETYTPEEVQKLLAACDGFSERTKLYLLLMLNCGMYQNDIAELRQGEVDWDKGNVKRRRSKTRKRQSAPVVTYRLWPETFELLKQFRSDCHERVLLTERAKPLVKYGVTGADLERYDVIQSAFERLTKRAGIRKPLKVFRKTSASMLEQHEVYGRYAQYFLAQSPGSVAERHSVKPSDGQFFAALDWLREQVLVRRVCNDPREDFRLLRR